MQRLLNLFRRKQTPPQEDNIELVQPAHVQIQIEDEPVQPIPADTYTNKQVIASYATFVFARENYLRIFLAAILTILGIGANFLAPYLLGHIVTSLSNETDDKPTNEEQIATITLLILVYTLSQALPALRERVLIPVSANNTRRLLNKITEHQLNKSLRYHIDTPQGDQIYLIQKGFSVAEMGTPLLTKAIPISLEVIIAVGALSRQYGASMGIGLSTLFAIYTAYSAATTNPIIQARENMLNRGREAWTAIMNAINRYKTIHDFNKLEVVMRAVEEAVRHAAEAEIRANIVPLDISYGQIAIPRIGMLAALLYVGMRIQANAFTVAEFIALFGYLNQLAMTLPAVGQALNQIFASYPDLRFVFKELAKPSEIMDLHPDNKIIVDNAPAISVQNVAFSYHGKNPVFTNLSLEIKPGQRVALVSQSGAGKSTLFNLLYSYYTANSGRIFINDQDITEVSRVSLQEKIGLIGQSPNLFNGSVRENIKFGAINPDIITDEDLFILAKKLNLAGFVCSLAKQDEINLKSFSEGLNVDAGEQGKALSGGQQQKVAILRGFLKQSPIVLLDEITASLDAESAIEVNAGIKNITENTTTIIITHRLAEITDVNNIFVIADGCISAQGTHAELLQHCRLYQTLWNKQNHPAPVAVSKGGLFAQSKEITPEPAPTLPHQP